MTEAEGKILKFRYDKFDDEIDTYDDHFTCGMVDSRFKGTLKEATKSYEFRVILKINKELYNKAIYEHLDNSLIKPGGITDRDEYLKLRDELHDQYRFYFLINRIFEELDESDGKQIIVDDVLDIKLDPSTAETIEKFSLPEDVDKFMRAREYLPKIPEIGKWSEPIKWVPNPP